MTDRVLINLTSEQVRTINRLRLMGYGSEERTPASVVEYMVARFIDDIRRAGLLKEADPL